MALPSCRHFDNTYILYVSRVEVWYCKLQTEFFHRFMRPWCEALASYLVEPETNARQAMGQLFLSGVKKRKLLLAHLAHYKDSPSKVKSKCDSAVLGLKKFIRSKLRVSTVSFSSSLNLLELLRHHCYLPENFRCNLKFFEGDNFSDSYFYQIFESGNFRFPFCYEKKLNLGGEKWKIQFQKNRVWMGQSSTSCS